MKNLFGDSVVAKLRSIPTFVWVLFVYVSFFFAHAYEYLLVGEYTAAMYADTAVQLGYDAQAFALTFGILVCLFETLISTLIAELILHITFGFVVGRFRADINKADYKFRLRYLILIVNLIVGVVSVAYFFTQKIDGVYAPRIRFFSGVINYTQADNPTYTILNAAFPFLAITLCALWFYEDFRKRFVPERNQAKLFSAYALIYVGVELILYVIDLVRRLISAERVFSTYDIAALSVEAGAFVLVGILYFFYYRRLKKDADGTHPEITILPEDKPSQDGNIYDDFGF